MDAVILAGGLGTRLRTVVKDVPKCMAPVSGRPFLYFLLKQLSQYPIDKVILSVGYLRGVIQEWIAEVGKEFSFTIEYAIEEEPLGTGGGIRLSVEKATSDDVLILNGDTYYDIDLNAFAQFHQQHGRMVSLALKPMRNFDRYGSVNLKENIIQTFNEKQFQTEGLINGGCYLINKKRSRLETYPQKFSFEKDFLEKVVTNGELAGFVQDRYFIDIGIPEDYQTANRVFPTLFNSQIAFKITEVDLTNYETLLLDRDGVINVYRPNDYVNKWEDFVFKENAVEMIAKWSRTMKHIFVVTNQGGIERGRLTEDDLKEIHKRMLEELRKAGGRIDKIYYCTTRDDNDINRKPNAGMFAQALKDFPDIDPKKCVMLGDTESDMGFAHNAGIDGILIERYD